MMLIGVYAGWLIDAGYLQFILISGTFMTTLGLFMLSICTKYWQILLAQAFCVGIGSGLLGLTSVAIIPLWFQRQRMVATGIAATGSSLGKIHQCPLEDLANRESWNLVSNNGTKTFHIDWLSLGSSSFGFHDTWKSACMHMYNASSTSHTKAWIIIRVSTFSRYSICCLLPR